MKLRVLFILVCGLFLTNILAGQSGCPGCLIDLPNLPEDTIYLAAAPDGQVGIYYDNDISFRMPRTTTPVAAVDPDVPAGIDLNSITILSVTNVPPGLNWELSNSFFDLPDVTDGCIKFCGTPLQPGLFFVEVNVEADVFFFTETASFEFPIYIAPGVSNTDGFSVTNNSGCGSVAASFTNNNPSNGAAGFSYLWNFGNGNSSIDENPGVQQYNSPGIYEVSYRAVVDTSGYYLAKVNILSVSCDDLFNNAPDLMVKVFNAAGEEIYVSETLNNDSPPVSFTTFVELGSGNYTLHVIDDDDGINGGDDLCGVVNFNRFTSGVLTDASMSVELEIYHPIDTVEAVDTIWVFEQPASPQVLGLPVIQPCDGDSFELETDAVGTLQWYQDSLALVGDTLAMLTVSESGNYWVTVTTADGCIATSESVEVTFSPLPTVPVFLNDNNLLSLFDLNALPANYSLQWYLNGEDIPGATNTEFCIPGTAEYTLEVLDNDTGCSSSYAINVTYDPDFPGCVSGTEQLGAYLDEIKLFPNPVRDRLQLRISAKAATELRWSVLNSIGQVVDRGTWDLPPGPNLKYLNVPQIPVGMYMLQIQIKDSVGLYRFVKQ